MRRTRSGIGECAKYVVDGLGGYVAKIFAHHADDRVGVGVRVRVDGVEHGDPRTRHAKVSASQQALRSHRRRGFQRRGHLGESVPFSGMSQE